MIVGIHPEDPFCHPITQEENDDYVLVDGVQKIALFKTNNRISGKFYEDAVVQDDRFLVFRDKILSNIGQLEYISDIRDLYDFFVVNGRYVQISKDEKKLFYRLAKIIL